MDTPLLATKLFVPAPRPSMVARPRLIERLQDAINCGFVLVSAPAGFGKTTAVSQWAQGNKEHTLVAWVSLDDGDNDPVRFWDYFIAAITTLKPTAGDAASTMLHSPQPYPIESVLTSLINDTADISQDFVVILDDYHLIKSDAVHAGLVFLLDHAPPKMHIVIVARADPPLPLPHFRGRGSLIEVGEGDLRFTLEESATLLKEMLGSALSENDVKALNQRTEGWVVGLKMAALSMRGQQDTRAFIRSFTGSHRYVMDYLMEEVLKRQTEKVHDFLLKTSVLEKLTALLCNFLTGARDGREMLMKLEQSNLFVIPLDVSRQWYRYHHLFAELLRHQLETTLGAEEVTRLHQRASQWYEEHDMPDDAIHHALAARDWERTMMLIGGVSDARTKRGEVMTLFHWLQAIPEKLLRADLHLYWQYTRILALTGHFNATETALNYLQETARSDAEQGEVATLQGDLAQRRGDINRSSESFEKALALLPSDDLNRRSQAGYRLGMGKYYRGFFDEGWQWLSDAYEMALKAGNNYVASFSLNFMAAITHQRGKLHRALRMAERALEIAGQSPAAAVPYCRLSMIPYELNDLERAARSARLAVEWNEISPDQAAIVGYLYQALVCLARGDLADAIEAMENSDVAALDSRISPLFHARHAAGHVMFALRLDDLETAANWGKRLPAYAEVFPFEFEYVPARLLIAQGEKAEATEMLNSLYQRAVKADAQGIIIGIRVCQSLAAPTEGEALAFLADALKMGEAEGYIRTFVDEGKLLKPLLRQALAQGVTPEYTAKLLSIIEAEEWERRGKGVALSEASEFISRREMEVLQLVAEGLSNQQIADKLTISLSTAKTHVYHLFEKLGAKDRLHAVTRARDLKLI